MEILGLIAFWVFVTWLWWMDVRAQQKAREYGRKDRY